MAAKSIFLIIFLITGFSLFATGQEPDILIYNGTEYSLIVNPMESYFKEFPEKRPKSTARSTSLWRGYVATFEIIQNEVWLIDIKILKFENINGRHVSGYVSVINEVFNGNNKIKLEWFNGLLVLPHGNMVRAVEMGYASTYEYYKILEIKNGNFVRELDLNNQQYELFRAKQFELYRHTEAYEKLIDDLKKDNISEEEILSFLRIYSIEYLEMIGE